MKIDDLARNYLVLSGENEDFEVEIIDVFEYQGNTYVCALPVDEPECEEVYILQECLDGKVAEYLSVDDEELLEYLLDELRERNHEIFGWDE